MAAELEYYSQYGEDFLLHWLFESVDSGFYVDIGAFDGRHLSNTYLFEQLGWSGICVEPHPDYFPLLQHNRPGAICVNAAIVTTPEPVVTFRKERLGLFSGLAGADGTPNVEGRYAKRGMTFDGFETVEVPALTPDSLMEAHAPEPTRIDILSIDTEGTELEILRRFNLDRCKPAAIVVEANLAPEREAITALLSAQGYHFARALNCNLIFCRSRDAATFLRHKRIRCRIADAVHPLGEEATPAVFRARVIEQEAQLIAPNVLRQERDQPLSALLEWFPEDGRSARTSKRIVHAVNLSSHTIPEQEATTRSLLRAAERDGGEVTLLNVQDQADPDLTPTGFTRANALTRDISALKEFRRPRPLPLLFDILDRATELAEPDDYVVFTNADICAQETFYTCLREFIGFGFDAITVNRRTIGRMDAFPAGSELPLAETGLRHPGFDCFVFRREMYDRFVKNLACVGMAGVTRGLLYNLVAHSSRMLMLTDVSMTYHYGSDQVWTRDEFSDYRHHNAREYLAVLASLCRDAVTRERLTAFCENLPDVEPARQFMRGLGSERRPARAAP